MKKLIAAALVGTMVLTMAGCGSKTAETTGSEASSDAAGGTLVMATNAEFPPYEYYEGEKCRRYRCRYRSSRSRQAGYGAEDRRYGI